MIAMHYRFALPADYDMAIIDRRIRDKGPLLDGYPHLRFKAYLAARRDGPGPGAENLYAPFYLWDDPAGIDRFLSSPGFAVLARDLGWPIVQTWTVQHADIGDALGAARFASCDIAPIAPYTDLAADRETAIAAVGASRQSGALAAITGFDPTGWTRVRFGLWRRPPTLAGCAGTVYEVGHLSLPDAAAAEPFSLASPASHRPL